MKNPIRRLLRRHGPLQLLHPVTRELDRRVPAAWVLSRAAISNTRRYCYFRIPKCANSTVVRTLAHYDPDIDIVDVGPSGIESKRRFSRFLALEASSPQQLEREYYCFTVVRNPYARLLSAYLDKIVDKGRHEGEYRELALRLNPDNPDGVTLERFVDYLEQGGLWENPHWVPQRSMLPLRPERLRFIGRVETLDTDLATVINGIFGEGSFEQVKSRETRRQGASSKLLQYYSPALAERVYRLYETDFSTFGYSRELS